MTVSEYEERDERARQRYIRDLINPPKTTEQLTRQSLQLQINNELETRERLGRQREINVEAERLIDTFDTLIDEVKTEEESYLQTLKAEKTRAVLNNRMFYSPPPIHAETYYRPDCCVLILDNTYEFPFTIYKLSFGTTSFKLEKPIILPPKTKTSIPLKRQKEKYVGNVSIAGKYIVRPKESDD